MPVDAATDDSTATAVLRGLVVDLDNRPVTAARVEVVTGDAGTFSAATILASGSSDAAGRFRVALPAGPRGRDRATSAGPTVVEDLLVSATRTGMGSTVPRPLRAADFGTSGTGVVLVMLRPGEKPPVRRRTDDGTSDTCVLIVSVVDSGTGNPVPSFTVAQKSAGELAVGGRDGGEFVVSGLVPGSTLNLYVEAAGYAPASESYAIPFDEPTLERRIAMGPGGTLTGRTVARATKEPVSGVKVVAWPLQYGYGQAIAPNLTTRTDADGRFRLDHLAVKPLMVMIQPEKDHGIRKIDNVTPLADPGFDLGDIELGDGCRIDGTLTGADGKPIGGAKVEMGVFRNGAKREKMTAEDGTFAFASLPENEWLSLSAEGGKATTMLMLQPDESRKVDLRVGSATLRGRVTAAGKPVGANVYAMSGRDQESDHRWKVTTNNPSDGVYEFAGLPPGLWTVTAHLAANGSNKKTGYVTVAAGAESATLDLELAGSTLRGQVLDSGGRPVYDAVVSAVPDAKPGQDASRHRGGPPKGRTNSDGLFEFAGIPEGTYAVTAEALDKGRAFAPGVVVEGGARDLRLRLARGDTGTLVSVASDELGRPLPSAWMTLESESGGRLGYDAKRGADGRVTVPDIPAGVYRATVGCHDRGRAEHVVTIRPGAAETLNDTLTGAGTFRWYLTGSDGRPRPGVACRIVLVDGSSGEGPREGRTDDEGLFTGPMLAAGTYRATAAIDGRTVATETFVVKVGGNFGPDDQKWTTVP